MQAGGRAMNRIKSGFSRRAAIKGILTFACYQALVFPVQAADAKEKRLVAYFSWGGNTRKVAELIAKETGASLLEIKTVKPYPSGYSEVGEVAKKEWQEKARPKLATILPADFDDYKVILVGYPVWNHTMPMPVYSFLENHDFSGKTIAPFSTHMGDDLADGPEQIQRICPEAKVLPGLAISGNDVAGCEAETRKWLQKNGLM